MSPVRFGVTAQGETELAKLAGIETVMYVSGPAVRTLSTWYSWVDSTS